MDDRAKSELASIVAELWSVADRLGALRNSIADREPYHAERKTLELAHATAVRAANIPAHLLHRE